MKEQIKKILKVLMYNLKLDLTQNQKYDRQTLKVMKRVLKQDSNCIDVGSHEGDILLNMLKLSPRGTHHAFEPIPDLFSRLVKKFQLPQVFLHQVALGKVSGDAEFCYVKNAPAYSGLKERDYKLPEPEIERINIRQEPLDKILPSDFRVDLIKIDVEGGEMDVIKGAQETIRRNKPVLIFECGLGASDHYGTQPADVYNLITGNCGLQLSLMDRWLKDMEPLKKEEFCNLYLQRKEYYFIAYPAK